MLADDSLGNVKPETCAVLVFAAGFIQLVETFKNIARLFRRNRSTGIFDAHNTTRDITLNFAQKINKAYICDMLENEIEELSVVHNKIKIRVKNYEIVTLKIV